MRVKEITAWQVRIPLKKPIQHASHTRTETEQQFKMMELKAHELSGYSDSSNVLLQDSAFGLEKFPMTLFARAIAWSEDFAFLQGNGVGKPIAAAVDCWRRPSLARVAELQT